MTSHEYINIIYIIFSNSYVTIILSFKNLYKNLKQISQCNNLIWSFVRITEYKILQTFSIYKYQNCDIKLSFILTLTLMFLDFSRYPLFRYSPFCLYLLWVFIDVIINCFALEKSVFVRSCILDLPIYRNYLSLFKGSSWS